jgi:hypothetical protein
MVMLTTNISEIMTIYNNFDSTFIIIVDIMYGIGSCIFYIANFLIALAVIHFRITHELRRSSGLLQGW